MLDRHFRRWYWANHREDHLSRTLLVNDHGSFMPGESPKAAMSEEVQTALPVQTVTVRTTTTSTILLTSYASGVGDFASVTFAYSPSVSPTKSWTTSSQNSDSPAVSSDSLLPPVGARVPLSTTQGSSTFSMGQETTTSSLSTSPEESSEVGLESQATKNAIVGGLSGAIAGLVLVGILLCVCLRRKRQKSLEPDELPDDKEKGYRPSLSSKWNGVIGTKGSETMPPKPEGGKSPVIIDDHLIRMSLDHWERPYAHNEGYRESMGPGLSLRCTNPDPSRPESPALPAPAHSPASFLKRQRSALTAVLLNASRSPASPNSLAVPAPVSTANRPPSQDDTIAANAPSSKSSSSIIRPKTPEDPFLMPPTQPHAHRTPSRPLLTPIQSATSISSASRTLSNMGSAMLNPFRSRSNVNSDLRRDSHSGHSITTYASDPSWRHRPHSDPFELDRPSVRNSRATQETSKLRDGDDDSGDGNGYSSLENGYAGKMHGLQGRVSAYEGT